MENQSVYPNNEIYFDPDKIRKIHKNIMYIMTRLGGKVDNSSYILLDGMVREAYGYYKFPKVGAVMTSLTFSNDLRCNFSVRFLGFEKDRNKFNKIKDYLEEALRRSGLNRVEKR
jgi:hypothetical protein